jgi:hypothetical protein
LLWRILGARLPTLFLVRSRRGNQAGIDGRACFGQITLGSKLLVDRAQKLLDQSVFVQQMSKPQGADPIGQTRHAIKAGKVAVHRGVKQRSLRGQIAQAKPLLYEKWMRNMALSAKGGGPLGLQVRAVQ